MKFEIFVEDIGDWSVGIRSETALRAELSENMIDYLRKENLLDNFETKLKALVEEFYQPEICYELSDTESIEAEIEFEKRMMGH